MSFKQPFGFLFEPGISVVKDAQLTMAAGTVTAMHDPTEGGLATALAELAEASGAGLQIEEERVPVLPEAARVAAAQSPAVRVAVKRAVKVRLAAARALAARSSALA